MSIVNSSAAGEAMPDFIWARATSLPAMFFS
jgi:hypothetical protein